MRTKAFQFSGTLSGVLWCSVCGLISITQDVVADSGSIDDEPIPVYREREAVAPDPNGAPAAALPPTSKQYDERLPPVLPGELIVTETGERMRVWSSSGPVPVNPPPPNTSGIGDVDVLLGGEALLDRREPPGRPLRPR